jgi:hypothetical protein
MSYATVSDMRRMFEKAILEDKYHVMITVENEDKTDLLSFTYGQGISDGDIVLRQILNRKKGA